MPTYGRVKVDTITYDLSGTATDVSVADIATKASPSFTGTVTVPTASANDNTTKAASTAYVQTELGDYALKAGPTFTGTINAASLVLSADLTVNGTTTTINTTTLQVEDKNIEIGKVSSPSDTTADGGGLTLLGATNKTWNWVNSTDAWTSSEHINVPDNKKLLVGTSSDLSIYHDGSNSFVKNTTGRLDVSSTSYLYLESDDRVYIGNVGMTEVQGLFVKDGQVELFFNNTKRFETTSSGVLATGVLESTYEIRGNDNVKFLAGNSNDFQIYHNGTNSYLDNNTNNIYIRNNVDGDDGGNIYLEAKSGETSIECADDGFVALYFDNTKRAETTNTGFNVVGALTVNGAALASGVSSDAQKNTVGGTNAGDSFTGTDANENTLFGYDAGTGITSGDRNTLIGYNAGKSITTTSGTVAMGWNAAPDLTTAFAECVFIGNYAGYKIQTASGDVCVGAQAGYNVTGTGTNSPNIMVGMYAGYNCTTGNKNTYIGRAAGYGGSSASASQGVAIGWNALYSVTTGGFNVCVGPQAGDSITTGDSNVMLGRLAGHDVTSGAHNILLGGESGTNNSPSGQVTTANGIVCLGDAEVTALYCQDTSISSSDSRDKSDVTNFTHGLSWINQLNPITYRWDKRSWYNEYDEDGSLKTAGTPDGSKKKARQHIGFLAQDVLAIEQADGFASKKDDMLVVNLNEDDTAYGLKYERLVPVLVNAIKELSTEVNTLKTKVAALEAA